MKSKFIKGTNEQYSIREDGIMTIHYKYTKNYTSTYNINRIIKPNKNKPGIIYEFVINRKRINRSMNTLLMDTFGYHICNKCTSKFIPNKSSRKCDECKRQTLCDNVKRYNKNHPNHVKSVTKFKVDTITKSYVAHILGLKIHQVTDELYTHHRNILLFKRNVAKEHNISIFKLNKL